MAEDRNPTQIVSKPVTTYVPDDMQTVLADGLYITLDQGSFILSFVQIEHPLVYGAEQASQIKEVRSRCVGRFAISPERMFSMADVLQQYLRSIKEREAQKADPSME